MTPVRWLPVLGLPLAVAGAVGWGAGDGANAAVSFLAGMAVALLVGGAGITMVTIATRIRPSYGMWAAMLQYTLSVIFFLILLLAVDPDSVSVPAFATGLAVSVVPYLTWQFARARPGSQCQEHS